MQPSDDGVDQDKPRPKPSIIVTRVVPLMIAIQVILTLAIYPFLPNTVPSHWNAAGHVDSYEPKWVFFGFLPIFSLLLYGFFAALIVFTGSRSNSQVQRSQQIESARMILKFVMLMQQSIFLITQIIFLVIVLRTGNTAAG